MGPLGLLLIIDRVRKKNVLVKLLALGAVSGLRLNSDRCLESDDIVTMFFAFFFFLFSLDSQHTQVYSAVAARSPFGTEHASKTV